MRKPIAILIFLGVIATVFCSSGFMAKTLNSGAMAHSTPSECCEDQAIAHQSDDISAVFFNLYPSLPGVFLLIFAAVLFGFNPKPNFQTSYTLYQFHKFSRGVFQLE
ncbi:MAG: hypothetical protein ACI9QC_000090 [Oceanicoccus sp.]|jgi:hypothetical protein